MLDQSIELNMIAWYSPIWFRHTILRLLLWIGSPVTSRLQERGSFSSHRLQRTLKDLTDVIQVRTKGLPGMISGRTVRSD